MSKIGPTPVHTMSFRKDFIIMALHQFGVTTRRRSSQQSKTHRQTRYAYIMHIDAINS